MHPFLLTSLDRFKNRINKTDTTNDDQIVKLIEEATGIADRFTGRNLRIRAYGTLGLDYEYGNGNGTEIYQARQWPIYAVSSLYNDDNMEWGSDFLKPATDYLIHIDRGEIQLYPKATKGNVYSEGAGNIRLAYTAGYGIFQVIDGVNDKLDFEETGSTELTATVAENTYDAAALLTALNTALDAAGASTHACTYDYWTGKFNLVSDRAGAGGTFKLLTNTGTNLNTSLWQTIGFSILADNADAASQEADNSALGIPPDLEEAVQEITLRIFNTTPGFGGSRFDINSETQGGSHGRTVSFNREMLPRNALATLKRYRRPPL